MKIVSLTGFGYSGSSALKDLLEEYKEVNVVGRGEYQIFDPPDGIRDLDNHINDDIYYINNSIAIRRFLIFMKNNRFMTKETKEVVQNYLNEFIELKWRGRTGFEKGILFGPSYAFWFVKRVIDEIYYKIFKSRTNILNTDFYMTKPNDNFDSITKKFVDEFFSKYGAKENMINCVDQLFPGIAPTKYFKYVNDPYCIVVDRDPRDIYLEAKRLNINLIPMKTPEEFVKYFRLTRKKQVKNERVEYIKFEDLIYNYDDTIKKLEQCLGISEHINLKKKFIPEVSKKNTQLFINTKYKNEVDYIAKELEEYLYDFPKEG